MNRYNQSGIRSNKVLALSFIGSMLALLALVVISSLLSIGDRLSAVHPALSAVFYGFVLIVVLLGVLIPVIHVISHPVFSLDLLYDDEGVSRPAWCRRLRTSLMQSALLTDADRAELEASPREGEAAVDVLVSVFNRRIVPGIDSEIKKSARFAFGATAVSQSSLIDGATMLSTSFNLVRSIVQMCGFRPSNLALLRLYVKVMASALVAGSIEEMDLETLLASVLGGGGGARISGLVMASAAQGFVNAFLVFRIGCMVKRQLCSTEGRASIKESKKASYSDALSLMKSSGFAKDAAEMIRDRASAAASAMAKNVKNAAQDMGAAARDTASAAAESIGKSIKNNPLSRKFSTRGN